MARRRQIDAVLFSSLVTGSLALLLQRTLQRKGVRTLTIAHGDDVILPVRLYQRVLPRMLAALDAVLPVSRATAKACIERGAEAEKVHVIPNGVDPQRFSPDQHEGKPRSKLGDMLDLPVTSALPDDVLLLCSTGRQVARKGFAWFVDQVMPLLPENVHYWLVGRGPEAGTIRAAIARNQLHGRVRLLGSLSDADLLTVYRNADLYVMPNVSAKDTMEGFGVVMLEAGMCGTPTIGSRLQGIEDVIAEGENGHLVDSGNAQAFADAVAYYVGNRSALQELRRSTLRCTKQFAWGTVVNRYVQTIQDVLKR
jgi:phosphatidylinositol alpha-1,6-mannosyltransferase